MITLPTLVHTHGKEVKEGNVLMLWAIALLVVVEEEEVCHANFKHVRVVAVVLHKVEPLLPAIPSSEECLGYLLRPAGPGVALNRQDVQLLPGDIYGTTRSLPQLDTAAAPHQYIVAHRQTDGRMDSHRQACRQTGRQTDSEANHTL